ncbi:MAG: tyrosine-type recombinase/integrase [Deltaproteobacteria bacterium]|nr:tyrosine-type recombinase/integrase [Deltaproteobacteria bacterium]
MTNTDLLLHVEAYVGLRQALGYTVRSDEKLLKDFVTFLASRHIHGPIRAQWAIDWACLPAPRRGPSGQATRLQVVRGFLSHVRATWPDTEVPGPGNLAPIHRPTPYLYTPREIAALFHAAATLGPRNSLRPYTYGTVIGLLASTGLRIGEALRLQVTDVRLDATPPHLHIVAGKFRKSRLVPLHPTTVEKLSAYAQERKRLHYDALSDAFFVSEAGKPLSYDACRDTFATLLVRAGIQPPVRGGRPGLHGLRHTFTVERMVEWQRVGLPLKELLPTLSVYLGHVQPAHTYWYLTATPELLTPAADAFQQYARQGGHHG